MIEVDLAVSDRVDFEYVLLLKSLREVTKHFEYSHAAFTYD